MARYEAPDYSAPTDSSRSPTATSESPASNSRTNETQRPESLQSDIGEGDAAKRSSSNEASRSEASGTESDASEGPSESAAGEKAAAEGNAQETKKGNGGTAKEAGSRKLGEATDPEATDAEATGKTAEKRSRLQEAVASAKSPEAIKAGAAKKAPGDLASDPGQKEASPQDASAAGATQAKRDFSDGEKARGKSAEDLGPFQAVNKDRGASLLSREVPREAPDNGGGKSRLRSDGKADGAEKEAGKSASRTTVILRGNARQSDGGTQNNGGNQASGSHDGFRLVADAGSREAGASDSSQGDSFRLDPGGMNVSGRASNPGTSSLEGGRDVAPRHLKQQLKDFATGDVVRHARFVLKENAGGEIRLLLKPEQLGTVRVRLEVQDNRIAGRIIVENTTVRDAFEQTLSELQRAFREAGLETGSLEVTVGEDGQAAGHQTMTKGRKTQAIEELEASVPTIIGELEEHRMINVYA